ncbi:MAG: acyl-CoA dehydrogenase, partial [Pseudomonadota bacterium]
VPKFIPDAEGNPGVRNGVSCARIEEKMGIHGNSTAVLMFDQAKGTLIGEPNKGLEAMFVMMNEARLGVGLQGYAQGEVAYQNALAWAQDRLQGRAITGVADADKPADNIMVHPDVRRNLLHQKSFVEGARMLTYWGAMLIDQAHRSGDKQADDLISLLTPVMKGFCTDLGFETTVWAQQTLGGSGFTQEWGLEQFVRYARITMIYEGTNGVQSLDLVGRKLPMNSGQTIMGLFDMVKSYIKENKDHDALNTGFLTPLKQASKDLQTAAMYFMSDGMKNPNNALAGSYDFMHLFGHTIMGLMWAKMAKASYQALETGAADKVFYETKLATGRYYMARHLPMTSTHLARIQSGAAPVMELEAANF